MQRSVSKRLLLKKGHGKTRHGGDARRRHYHCCGGEKETHVSAMVAVWVTPLAWMVMVLPQLEESWCWALTATIMSLSEWTLPQDPALPFWVNQVPRAPEWARRSRGAATATAARAATVAATENFIFEKVKKKRWVGGWWWWW